MSKTPPAARFGSPKSHSGTRVVSGRVRGHEKNPDLYGRRGIEAALYYLRTDPSMMELYLQAMSMMVGTRVQAPPISSEPLAVQVAAFMEEALGVGRFAAGGMLRQNFRAALRPLLRFWFFGFAYSEWTLYVGRGRDGELRYWVDKFHSCEQSAHGRWEVTEDGRELVGITQYHGVTRQLGPLIERERLVLVVHDQVGGNFDGLPCYRPASFYSRMKEHGGNVASETLDAQGYGISERYTDLKAAREAGLANDDPQIKTWEDDLAADLERMHAGFDENGDSPVLRTNSVVHARRYGEGAAAVEQLRSLWDACDGQMMGVSQARYQRLGIGKGEPGARSVAEVHAGGQRVLQHDWAQTVCDAIHADVLVPLVRLNFGEAGVRVMPPLEPMAISEAVFAQILPYVQGLVGIGVLTVAEARGMLLRLLRVPGAERAAAEALEQVDAPQVRGAP